MKTRILAKLAVCCLALQLGGQEKSLAAAVTLKTEPQKVGYALGMSLGKSLKKMDALMPGNPKKPARKTQQTTNPSNYPFSKVDFMANFLVTGAELIPIHDDP